MPFTLTARDEAKLSILHPDLQRVIKRAATLAPFRFRITEGMRTLKRQRELFKTGASKTMNSRHLTGHAVDIVPYIDFDGDGDIDGKDLYAWPLYYKLAPIIKEAAKIEGVKLDWGGDWKSFKDGPHWQLNWKAYPIRDVKAEKAPLTEKEAASVTGASIAATATVAADPLKSLIDVLTSQQAALGSGDWMKAGVAGLIVLGTAAYLWQRSRK